MAKTNWAIDPAHSEIGFKVKHMMFTNVSGKLQSFEAAIESEGEAFETTTIRFTANVESINTNDEGRDKHLKGADFFDVEKFPRLSFVSTGLKKISDDKYRLSGDLTIKDTTRPVDLDVEYSGLLKDPWGNTRVAAVVNGKINRKDFGLTWNAALETGGVLVGEEVKLIAEVQLIKQ